MSNAPERHEAYELDVGEAKVVVQPETRVPNAATFIFNKEDHTLANLIRAKLFNTPSILFSGYKVPHPLFPRFELRIQTDGTLTPKAALIQACKERITELDILKKEFTKEWELKKISQMADGVNGDKMQL